jgi:hypothetical protein
MRFCLHKRSIKKEIILQCWQNQTCVFLLGFHLQLFDYFLQSNVTLVHSSDESVSEYKGDIKIRQLIETLVVFSCLKLSSVVSRTVLRVC